MSDSFMKIIQSAGCIIFKSGEKYCVVKQPKAWLAIARFVVALIALICLGFGVAQIATNLGSYNGLLKAGLIFTGIGLCFLYFAFLVQKEIGKTSRLQPEMMKCLCIIDLENNRLLSESGTVLSDLKNVYTQRVFQVTSSSPALAIVWPEGRIVIAKGNPFIGGIAPIESLIKANL